MTVYNTGGGTIEGPGKYSVGSICTLKATEYADYKFEGWYEYGSLVSTSKIYSFTVENDRHFEARFTAKYGIVHFGIQGQGFIRNYLENDSGWSVVNIMYGTTIFLEAVPKSGWKFVRWQGSSGSTSGSIYHTVLSESLHFEAIFEPV
nr:InlB B-repeat-containing protein [Prevotella sp. 10(H)]